MDRSLKLCYFIALVQILLVGAAFSGANQIAAQRLNRPPSREAAEKSQADNKADEKDDKSDNDANKDANSAANTSERLTRAPIADLNKAAVIPAGADSIPEGTKLIVELETPLSSKESRAGDRFTARISTPVVDQDGNTLVPADSIVEGSVVDAQPAKRRRRSGIIQLTFENLRLDNDVLIPIRGRLTNAETDDRNRFDEEGNIKSPSSTKGALKITGASAGAGIALGAAAGGALAGAGVGAVAGLTIALLMKGSDVIIEPGHRFGLELIQPLRVRTAPEEPTPARPILRPTPRNKVAANSTVKPASNALPSENEGSGVAVEVSDVRSERTSDGMLMILITAKTPGAGWRILADHVVSGDQVEVDLRGVAPAATPTNRISHPTAPTIRLKDNDGLIKRVVVRAKNGVRESRVRTYPGASRPSLLIPNRARPKTTPESTKPANASPSGAATTTSGTTSGPRVETEILKLRNEFGSSVGIRIDKDGAYEVIGTREANPDETQLLDALGSQLNSVRAYNRNYSKASVRRKSALLVEEDLKLVDQIRMRVKMSREMNQRFRSVQQNAQTLIEGDLNETQPSATSQPATTTPSGPSGSSAAPVDSASLSDLATTVIGEITQCQYDIGGTVGAFINPDGSYDLVGERKATADEQQILDGLRTMLSLAKEIVNSRGGRVDQNNAEKFRNETNRVGQAWRRVKMTAEMNQNFSKMLRDARSLSELSSR
jgi:hypothetical protein